MLDHTDNDTFPWSLARRSIDDFDATATFQNPGAANWDYGFVFRRVGVKFHSVVVANDGQWFHNLREGSDGVDQHLANGTTSYLQTSETDSNIVQVTAIRDTGYLFVNGMFVSELDLASGPAAGDVAVIAGFFRNSQLPGQSTTFRNFVIKGPPTPTPTPTPTPRPTAIDDFTIDANTTGHDLLAVLTAGEVSCIRNALSQDAYTTFLGTSALDPALELPGECISAESTSIIIIGRTDTNVGGLSPDSTGCLRSLIAAQNPDLIWSTNSEDLASINAFSIDFVLCLTDEESAKLFPNTGTEPFIAPFIAPSQLRCMVDAAGKEKLVALFTAPSNSSALPLVELFTELLPAIRICGVDPQVFASTAR